MSGFAGRLPIMLHGLTGMTMLVFKRLYMGVVLRQSVLAVQDALFRSPARRRVFLETVTGKGVRVELGRKPRLEILYAFF